MHALIKTKCKQKKIQYKLKAQNVNRGYQTEMKVFHPLDFSGFEEIVCFHSFE